MSWTNEKQKMFEVVSVALKGLFSIKGISEEGYKKICEILQEEADKA